MIHVKIVTALGNAASVFVAFLPALVLHGLCNRVLVFLYVNKF
ncbi:hypothetical protein [Anaerobutyricum soehngenii]|nr:Uncharacterised protein [uncultured Eubacterium sp.]